MTGAWPPVVLKYKFYYYLGRVKPGVRRCLPGKIVCYSRFPRGGGTQCQQGRTGRPPGGWRQREGGAVQTRDLTEVSAGGVDKAGWAAEDWLVWIFPAGSRAQGPSPLRATCPGWRGQVDGGPKAGSPLRRCGRWALGWPVCTGRRARG